VLTVLLLLRIFRKPVSRWLIKIRAKLQIHSLREAIADADHDKQTTGRKNMVVFNQSSGKFEPLQKRLLKIASNNTRNKSNKAMTEGRKKMMQKKKTRVFDNNRVKQIEKKSLYVTN
jgi:hypothetical protein